MVLLQRNPLSTYLSEVNSMNKTQEYPKIRALIRLCAFSLVFFLMLFTLDSYLFSGSNIHPTWAYISDPEHEPVDILFVGNSHTYTTIDAEYISKATGLNVRALTCPSINGEISATIVEAALHYEVPEVIVLDICPFSVNNFEDMRTDYLGLVLQHLDGIPDYLLRLKAVSQIAPFESIPSGVFQLLRNTLMWDRWKTMPYSASYDAYGSSKTYDVYFAREMEPSNIRESFLSFSSSYPDYRMFEQNQIALHKILALAEEKNIDIWIYNAPIAGFSITYGTTLAYIDSIRDSQPCIRYVDNAMLHLDTIGITKTDFYDAGHLNPNGMYKVSAWMAEKIGERYQLHLDPDPQTMYKDSSVSMLTDNTYCYSFTATGENLYRFVYTKGQTEVDTGYSNQNFFVDTCLTKKELESVQVYVLTADLADDDSNAVCYRFLPYVVESYTATIKDNHTLEITNESNFSENLTFAWDFIDKETEERYEYAYAVSPTVSHTFSKSGTYNIRAFTRQISDNTCRAADIMTITYDADTDQLTLDSSSDCITIK